ncbi:MAG: hypothetical protein COA78_28525 [Blastopirellula sp.]|nr:MAG: hypothetical protein COA78_28525 [Blastopirellula sp.]
MAIVYSSGYKYVIRQLWEWRLRGEYIGLKAFDNVSYFLELRTDGYWYIGAYPGYASDGATKAPDFDMMFEGFIGHDILSQLIEVGAIPEGNNMAIDHEFEVIAVVNGPRPKIGGEKLLRIIARIYRRGTNLYWSRKGNTKTQYIIDRNGKREYHGNKE